MSVERFVHEQLPQRIVFGWARLTELPEEIERLDARRLLLISERSTAPIATRIEDLLPPGAIGAWIGPVRPHVPAEDAAAARARAVEEAVDLVVTVGGGSATGLGKAVAVTGIPLLAIPTTYAGSEVTPIYGTTETGQKRTGRDARAQPKTVIYDPSLTTTLPARATATTGMNAIAHSVEALYAENANPLTTLIAHEAIAILARSLPSAIEAPGSQSARSDALYGSYLAGSVLAVSGMAIHHRICHVLGGALGISHGDANAVILPHAVAFNEPVVANELRPVGEQLGSSSAAVGLFELARSMHAPSSLGELGVDEGDLERVASLVMQGDHYNPRPVERAALMELLARAYEGAAPVSS